MSIYERKKCLIDGCNSLCRNKGMINGKNIYGNKCARHHRSGSKDPIKQHIINRMENKICENCGWDKAYCDRHRITPELGYIKENVKILCPNCHRLATVGILAF